MRNIVLMENITNRESAKSNKLTGVWKLKDAYLLNDTGRVPILGENPNGTLVFTKGLNFSVIVNNPDIANFVSGDRLNGTSSEYKIAMQNSLALYGTYRVDMQGDFLDQKIHGSTFSNWNGLSRGREILQLAVEGTQIIENMIIPDVGVVEIIWDKIEAYQ